MPMTSKAIGAGADRWALPACTLAHLHAEGPTAEKRLYISSLPVDPDLALKAVRAHWGIENRLHWTLDVVFGEDYCRARTKHAAENRVTVRRIAINLLNRHGKEHGCGTKHARFMANQSPEALEAMFAA